MSIFYVVVCVVIFGFTNLVWIALFGLFVVFVVCLCFRLFIGCL